MFMARERVEEINGLFRYQYQRRFFRTWVYATYPSTDGNWQTKRRKIENESYAFRCKEAAIKFHREHRGMNTVEHYKRGPYSLKKLISKVQYNEEGYEVEYMYAILMDGKPVPTERYSEFTGFFINNLEKSKEIIDSWYNRDNKQIKHHYL